MTLAIIVPLMLGFIGIMQGILNKQMAQAIGLTHAAFITAVMTLVVAIPFYISVKLSPNSFSEIFHIKQPFTYFKWWYWLPGTLGLFIVTGLPFAFAKFGAAKVTILLVAAQMITSVGWDVLVEKIPLVAGKVVGLILAFASVLVITLTRA
jgi:transporter family-2 protein